MLSNYFAGHHKKGVFMNNKRERGKSTKRRGGGEKEYEGEER